MEKVTLYTRPTCPFCNNLKKILKEKGITYKDYDVTIREAPRWVVEKSGHIPVPQVDIK